MGTSTNAYIAFGINIDEGELPESIETLLEEGKIEDFWQDELAAYEGGLVYNGEEGEEYDAYYDKKQELVKNYPVEIEMHCHYDCAMYVVAVRGTILSASRGFPTSFGTDHMTKVEQKDIDALKAWCEKYGLEGEPEWLLFSYWG